MLLNPNLAERRTFSTITTSTFEEFLQYSIIFLNSLKALLRYGLLDSADCKRGKGREEEGGTQGRAPACDWGVCRGVCLAFSPL